ncbi:MAG: universal stress protein [Bacteroidia bacterium]|nr:universal stress protein [Bacteroidia bacterium]
MRYNNYNRMMVGMDLTDFDQKSLAYVKDQAGVFQPEDVYFLHVSPALDLPLFMSDSFSSFPMPIDEQVEMNMAQAVEPVLGNHSFRRHYDVQEGGVTKQLLHWIRVKRIELAIMGHRGPHYEHALSARRFVRRADCDVMFVPSNEHGPLNKIVVATDFSTNSQWALQKAAALAKNAGGKVKIEVLHVYDIPTNLHNQIGRAEDQFDKYYKDSLQDFLVRFLDEEPSIEGLDVEPILLRRGDTTLAHSIVKYMESSDADMLMMGAKGHNDLDVFFLGSFTEQVLSLSASFPLLVVKNPAREAPETIVSAKATKQY